MLDSTDEVEMGESSRSAMAANGRDGRARRVGGGPVTRSSGGRLGRVTGRRWRSDTAAVHAQQAVAGPDQAQNRRAGPQELAGRPRSAIAGRAARVVEGLGEGWGGGKHIQLACPPIRRFLIGPVSPPAHSVSHARRPLTRAGLLAACGHASSLTRRQANAAPDVFPSGNGLGGYMD